VISVIAALALPAAPSWHYAISVDPQLTVLTTTVCVSSGRLPALEANASIGEDYALERPRTKAGCARSRADLARAIRDEDRLRAVSAVGRDVTLSPDLFMWVREGGFAEE
jgi:hypothetical protein